MVFRSKYRSRLEIIADILDIVKGGSKKTHIMFQANLSYKLLCRYLDEVLEAGLVRFDGSMSKRYYLTGKGEVFLERCREYFERKKEVQEKIALMAKEREFLEEMLKGAC